MNYLNAPGLIHRKKPVLDSIKIKVLEVVCLEYGVTVKELQSKSRKHEIVEPRQIACYLLRKFAHMSCIAVGKEFFRDHTTVLVAEQAVKDHMAYEEGYRERVSRIIEKIFT